MNALIALHIALLTLTDRARTGLTARRHQQQDDPEAGLSTLEITVIGLGLFLIAGVAVVVLTGATQSRLDKIK